MEVIDQISVRIPKEIQDTFTQCVVASGMNPSEFTVTCLKNAMVDIAKNRYEEIVKCGSMLFLGNSPGVLLVHYRELVTKEQSDAFWSIIPQ